MIARKGAGKVRVTEKWGSVVIASPELGYFFSEWPWMLPELRRRVRRLVRRLDKEAGKEAGKT